MLFRSEPEPVQPPEPEPVQPPEPEPVQPPEPEGAKHEEEEAKRWEQNHMFGPCKNLMKALETLLAYIHVAKIRHTQGHVFSALSDILLYMSFHGQGHIVADINFLHTNNILQTGRRCSSFMIPKEGRNLMKADRATFAFVVEWIFFNREPWTYVMYAPGQADSQINANYAMNRRLRRTYVQAQGLETSFVTDDRDGAKVLTFALELMELA